MPSPVLGSVIDLTIVSPILETYLCWEVLPSPLSSDHLPILINNALNIRNNNDTPEGYNHRKGRYKEIESDMVWQQLPTDIGIDPKQSISTLYGILNEFRNKHIHLFRRRRFFPQDGTGCAVRLGDIERDATDPSRPLAILKTG